MSKEVIEMIRKMDMEQVENQFVRIKNVQFIYHS